VAECCCHSDTMRELEAEQGCGVVPYDVCHVSSFAGRGDGPCNALAVLLSSDNLRVPCSDPLSQPHSAERGYRRVCSYHYTAPAWKES
jgi:hypothetical protein